MTTWHLSRSVRARKKHTVSPGLHTQVDSASVIVRTHVDLLRPHHTYTQACSYPLFSGFPSFTHVNNVRMCRVSCVVVSWCRGVCTYAVDESTDHPRPGRASSRRSSIFDPEALMAGIIDAEETVGSKVRALWHSSQYYPGNEGGGGIYCMYRQVYIGIQNTYTYMHMHMHWCHAFGRLWLLSHVNVFTPFIIVILHIYIYIYIYIFRKKKISPCPWRHGVR